MLRAACVFFTILSLLACPLTCMSEGAFAADGTDGSAKTASCCSHCGSQDEPHRGAPSEPCDPCANCACHGAVVTKDDLRLDAEAPAGMLPFEADRPVDAAVAASRLCLCAIDASGPGVRSGRLLRYALQSLLL